MPVIAALRRLRTDRRAAMLVEFALGLPMFVLLLGGLVELATFVVTREQVSQLALMVADNASRMGSQDVLTDKPISEGEINDLLRGAQLQSGGLDIAKNGRIIVSSLEYKEADGGQWIHWQRCDGELRYASSYGLQGAGMLDKSVTGMGPANGRAQARKGMPTMFVEIAYTYTPVMMSSLVPSRKIVETAAMTVRDSRRTTGGYLNSGVDWTPDETPSYCV